VTSDHPKKGQEGPGLAGGSDRRRDPAPSSGTAGAGSGRDHLPPL